MSETPLDHYIQLLNDAKIDYWRLWRYSDRGAILVLAGVDIDERIGGFAVFGNVSSIRLTTHLSSGTRFGKRSPILDAEDIEIVLQTEDVVHSVRCRKLTYYPIDPASVWLGGW